MWWWAAAAMGQEPAAAAATAGPVELTLAEALDRLHTQSPDLAQVQARVDAAHGVARQAMAAWLPVLAASGGYTRNDHEVVFDFGKAFGDMFAGFPTIPGQDPPAPPDLPPVTIQPLEVWNVALNLNVPLFAPSSWAESRAVGHNVDQAEATAEEMTLQLESALVAAAAGVDAARGLTDAAQKGVEVAEAHLASTRVAVAAGTATSVDELTAQADLARRRSDLVSAKSALDKAQDQLGALLGVDGPVIVTLPAAPPVDAAGQPRPAIAAARAQAEAADARVTAAWLRHLPTVGASGTVLAQTEPFPTTSKTAYRLGVTATWALYDGGFRYGRLEQAQADRAAAEAFQTSEQLRVSREVRDAERDLGVATEQLALAQDQARLATAAADVAQRGLAAGTVSALQARDVETSAFQADVAVAAARARLWIAQAALRRANGLDQRW